MDGLNTKGHYSLHQENQNLKRSSDLPKRILGTSSATLRRSVCELTEQDWISFLLPKI